MAITYRPPLTVPNTLTATVTASGGSLAIGTYYFFVIDSGANASYNLTPQWHSPAVYSGAVSVTVANSKIDLSWVSPDANKVRSMVFWKKDADFYMAQSQAGITGTSITFTSYTTQRVSYMPCIENATKTPHGFSSTRGVGTLVFSGAVGSITIADIAAVLLAAGATDYYYDGYSSLWMLHSLDFRTATSGRLTLTGNNIWTYGGLFNNAATEVFELYSAFPGTDQGLASIGVGAYCGSASYFFPGKCNLKFCQWITNVTGLTGNMVYGGARANSSANSKLEFGFENGTWTAGTKPDTAKNSWLGGEYIYSGNNNVNEILGLRMWGGFRINHGYQSFILRDLISNAEYNFRYTDDNYNNVTPGLVQRFVDCLFYDAAGTPRANNLPMTFWILGGGGDVMKPIPCCYSCNIKVQDVAGNPIQNATVKIKYNGNIVNSGVSNALGNIPEQYIVYGTIKHKVGSGQGTGENYQQYEVFNPFTIEISATGYETYTSNAITLNNKIAEVISLKPIIPVRKTIEGDDYIAMQPALGSSSILNKI